MLDLKKIGFETINTEIYINVKDVFKVYAEDNNKALTFFMAFCRTNNITLKFNDYLLVSEFLKYFESYTPKRNQYRERYSQIKEFVKQKANDLLSDEIKIANYFKNPTLEKFPRKIKSVRYFLEKMVQHLNTKDDITDEGVHTTLLKYLFPYWYFVSDIIVSFKNNVLFLSIDYDEILCILGKLEETSPTLFRRYELENFVKDKLKEFGWDVDCSIVFVKLGDALDLICPTYILVPEYQNFVYHLSECFVLRAENKNEIPDKKEKLNSCVEDFIDNVQHCLLFLFNDIENNRISSINDVFRNKDFCNTYHDLLVSLNNIRRLQIWIEGRNYEKKDFLIRRILT